MTNSEMNEFIKHYLEENKTKSAIMLSGSWGSGKSYYINTELVPFLMKEGENRCVVVSLYGIKDISEISKSIYLELRVKILKNNNEIATAGKIFAKTIAKGVMSFFGIDLSTFEDEIQNLYESIDLSNKLIILEDIERSQADILEVLGYVNNLVEQDGIKVLLVANEAELLEYEKIESEINSADKFFSKVLTKKSVQYLKTKEKTVSDTIIFKGDYFSAIRNIIAEFKDKHLSPFLNEENIREIFELLAGSQNGNLRTFIYACQKTSDIFSIINNNIGFEDKRTIFYSIILFSKHIKAGAFPEWEGSNCLSTKLGSKLFPLYYFCYEYIRWQAFDIDSVSVAIAEHTKMKLYQHHGHDADLNIIENFYIQTEKAVLNALNNITVKLQTPERIPFYEYGNLVYFFVECHELLGFDYSDAKSSMIKNIHEKGSEIDGELLFLTVGEFKNEAQTKQFEAFKKDILQAIADTNKAAFAITYKTQDITDYYTYVTKNRMSIRSKHKYMSVLDIDKFESMIFECTAEQLYGVRGILFAVYRDCRKGDFTEADINCMIELKHRVETKMTNSNLVTDRIIMLQLRILCENLQQFIDQLS